MPEPSPKQILEQLEKLCACKGLAKKKTLTKLLRYVVLKALEGNLADLNEYAIGVDVYSKFGDWKKNDPTVRVAMTRLREQIREYYETDGKTDSVRIYVEPGTYVPEFSHGVLPKPTLEVPETVKAEQAKESAKPSVQVAGPAPPSVPSPPKAHKPVSKWKGFLLDLIMMKDGPEF